MSWELFGVNWLTIVIVIALLALFVLLALLIATAGKNALFKELFKHLSPPIVDGNVVTRRRSAGKKNAGEAKGALPLQRNRER
ncbi:hypothetical protein KSF_109370 [Reticulibacter mediterranei]|uniref:Uncharacterized protein n=1 Tax=Reticulibacter mediterranei TaxID=2778369 RepID=A0A8J3IRU2_9CHLR|nr:hypothetical protein [Reticulibacter mediterranei]GHP00890.1 hypothetical protein KSF_109370 [Reticulibacter mediterranei]